MICNLCYKVNDPNVGFSLTISRNEVKCYLSDTGLLFSQAFNESEIKNDNLYDTIINGKLAINKGMLFENIIAQMLTAMNKNFFILTTQKR